MVCSQIYSYIRLSVRWERIRWMESELTYVIDRGDIYDIYMVVITQWKKIPTCMACQHGWSTRTRDDANQKAEIGGLNWLNWKLRNQLDTRMCLLLSLQRKLHIQLNRWSAKILKMLKMIFYDRSNNILNHSTNLWKLPSQDVNLSFSS